MSKVTVTVQKRPRNWESMVLAAHYTIGFRLNGRKLKQEEIALQLHVTPRAIRLWKASPHWDDAIREAEKRWRGTSLRLKCMTTIDLAVERDPVMALKVLERIDPDFAPPGTREPGGTGDIHVHLGYGQRPAEPVTAAEDDAADVA